MPCESSRRDARRLPPHVCRFATGWESAIANFERPSRYPPGDSTTLRFGHQSLALALRCFLCPPHKPNGERHIRSTFLSPGSIPQADRRTQGSLYGPPARDHVTPSRTSASTFGLGSRPRIPMIESNSLGTFSGDHDVRALYQGLAQARQHLFKVPSLSN